MAGQDVESRLRFAVLGPVRAWRDGSELDLGTPLQRSILGMLLLREGRAVTPTEMIDAVWGEEAPPRALGALRTYVSRLRTVLEPHRPARTRPDLLTSVGRGYALRLPPNSLDLTRFEAGIAEAETARRAGKLSAAAECLRVALGLFEGEPLAGAVGPYAEHQRDRLVERRLNVIESLMDLDLELGNHAAVVSELIALTADHPLRERLRAQLMLAYYRCGRQGDALAVFTETREALIEELGIEPGPELAALHQRILAADPTLAVTPAATGAAAGAAAQAPEPEEEPAPELPRPAQLPAAVNDFTGRREIAGRLRTLLSAQSSAEGVPVAVICGIGGVGKTTLAVHVAHASGEVFPDGQLYVDLRGYADEATAPESALGAFLRALGIPPDVIPEVPAERSALYRSLLADRRILVLLDNARDAAQVSPLLPGSPGCAALVTSRVKLADLPSARLIDLDVMEPDEALSLFAAVAGPERVAAERAAAMDVVAACGFLPLAVRIVAARLAARPSWTVGSLVSRLADEQRRLDELRVGDLAVEATFALGYGQLEAAQARAFRLLSLPTGPGHLHRSRGRRPVADRAPGRGRAGVARRREPAGGARPRPLPLPRPAQAVRAAGAGEERAAAGPHHGAAQAARLLSRLLPVGAPAGLRGQHDLRQPRGGRQRPGVRHDRRGRRLADRRGRLAVRRDQPGRHLLARRRAAPARRRPAGGHGAAAGVRHPHPRVRPRDPRRAGRRHEDRRPGQ